MGSVNKQSSTKTQLDDSSEIHSDLLNACKENLIEMFKSFVFTDIQIDTLPGNSREAKHEHNAYFYMGSNRMNAFMCLSFSNSALMNTVKKILGDPNATEKDAIDAQMEFSNVIYGGLKKRLQVSGYTFGLASYQYSKLNVGELIIKDDISFGYEFTIISDLGPLSIKILYDTIEKLHEVSGVELNHTTVNSSYVDGYMPIKFTEISTDKEVPFNLYLHLRLNKKTLLYKKGGSKVTDEIFSRFRNYQIDQFYIKNEDQEKFISYIAEKTGNVIKDDQMALPLKKDKLEKAAVQMISGFFDDADNRDAHLENAQKIVNELVNEILEDSDPLKKILSKLAANLKSTETHSLNVQAFSTVMAMTMGYTTSKALVSIATGALFHDIGYSKIPIHLHHKEMSEVLLEDAELLKKHPQMGVDLLTSHSQAIPYEAKLIIQQHHEHHDGSGFPKGIKGFQTYELSKIVAIANEFEGRTKTEKGHRDPVDVVREIWHELKEGPVVKFEPNLFKKIFLKMAPAAFE